MKTSNVGPEFGGDMDIKAIAEQRGLVFHHRAMARGYLSRKGIGKVVEYKGKFGEGVAHMTPRWDTTRYITVDYYIRGSHGH